MVCPSSILFKITEFLDISMFSMSTIIFQGLPGRVGTLPNINLLLYFAKIDKQCLGSIYTKRQRQRCDKFAMMLAILFSLKTMELLQNGVATHFQATMLFSLRT